MKKILFGLRILLTTVFLILVIVEITTNLDRNLLDVIQKILITGIIGIISVESYQDKKWWLFGLSSVLTLIALFLSVQSLLTNF